MSRTDKTDPFDVKMKRGLIPTKTTFFRGTLYTEDIAWWTPFSLPRYKGDAEYMKQQRKSDRKKNKVALRKMVTGVIDPDNMPHPRTPRTADWKLPSF